MPEYTKQHREAAPRDTAALRQRAEAHAKSIDLPALSAHTPEEVQQMLQELRVQQIELEMQNEELRRAQELIETERVRYFDLYDLAPVGYCIVSDKGLILDANTTTASLLGTERNALVKQPITRLISAEDQDIYYLHHRQVLATGQAQECELRLVRQDGAHSVCWVQLAEISAWAQNGAPVVRVTFSDISARKQAEAALRKSESVLRATVDGLSAQITVLDHQGAIILTNKSYRDFGMQNGAEARNVCEGAHYLAVCDATFGEDAQQGQTFAEGLRDVLSGKHPYFEMEYPCHSPEEKRWFIARVTPMGDDGPRCVVVAHENITERKLAEAALQDSENRFRELLMNIPAVAVQGYNEEGTTRYWNHASERLYGHRAEEAIGRNLLDLIIPPDMHDGVRAAMRDMFNTTTPIPAGELSLLRKDGSRVEVFSSHAYVQVPGRPPEMFCVDVDMTERKLAEQALRQTLKEKQALLMEVNHRVKNNLQVISSLLRMETRRSQLAETQAVLNDMQGRIRSMALLHKVLYRSGTFSSVDLGSYLHQVASQAFVSQARSDNLVRLSLHLDSVQVGMDQAISTGLLVNELISNCLKHAFPQDRAGEVVVVLHPVDADANTADTLWHVGVSDTGVGLPPDVEQRRKTSLGLQLADDLGQQIGGSLQIESQPSQGARFTLLFTPLAPKPLVMPQ